MKTPRLPSRRRFLKTVGAAALTAPFFTRNLISAAPSATLRHASFGSAGQAWADLQAICSNPFVKLVAVAEVDLNRIGQVKEWFPEAKVYQDWRELLEKEKNNIDSVNVSTPDHLHAPIGISAMQLGKHVYGEKPLAHDLYEVRAMTKLAREKKLITQMGIQIHSQSEYRLAVALVQGGAIGKVREVHVWSNKKWGDVGAPPAATASIPEGFNWDLWLGGVEPRPYIGNTYYHPENWRKRLDFGTGTFGDMGCHLYDPVFNSLALTAPISLRSEGPAPDNWNWAINARIKYTFPGTRYTADKTVAVTWYDGDERPPAEIMALVPQAEPPQKDSRGRVRNIFEQGSILIGTEGVMHIPHIANPRLFPLEKFKDYPMPKVEGTHHWSDWAEGCLSGKNPSANFGYAGPLTEAVLLGSVAVRFPHQDLQWDSARLSFTNEKKANTYVQRKYRHGWQVAGL